MANYDNPNGARALGSPGRLTGYISGAAVSRGDVVTQVSGKVVLFDSESHSEALGVAAHAATGADLALSVFDSPSEEFVIQTETGVSYTSTTHNGRAFDVSGATGAQELNLAGFGQGVLQIIRQEVVEGSEDDAAAHARVRVRIVRHQLAPKRLPVVDGLNVETLTGNLVLNLSDPSMQKLDPGGSARDVTLPAEAGAEGRQFRIVNAADAAENLVVKSDAPATIGTISQNEEAIFYCDGVSWVLVRIATIALS